MVTDAAKLLKLTEENLQQLLSQKIALPVARTLLVKKLNSSLLDCKISGYARSRSVTKTLG